MDRTQLNQIQTLRWDRNMSLHQLERKSGVSKSALDRIENGRTIPNQIQMINISKAFGLPVADVFNLEWRGYL